MTKRQKEKIIKMCRDGFGYSRISTTLGISENTVKSFCRRNLSSINAGPHVQKDGILCRQCGLLPGYGK
ncbi:LuxR C-terminal-related transcriptional regulator [Syntrophomonas erecta subsp. sporosyntropha]